MSTGQGSITNENEIVCSPKLVEEIEVPKCMPGVGNSNTNEGVKCTRMVGGDFRWSEGADEQLLQTERDLARQFWLRWRKE